MPYNLIALLKTTGLIVPSATLSVMPVGSNIDTVKRSAIVVFAVAVKV